MVAIGVASFGVGMVMPPMVLVTGFDHHGRMGVSAARVRSAPRRQSKKKDDDGARYKGAHNDLS